MEENETIVRVEKFERTVATCLASVPLLFSLQLLSLSLTARVFQAMFADFGARLPGWTVFVTENWYFWAAFAVITPVVSFTVARKGPARTSVIFSTIASWVSFVAAQSFTIGLFLPIFQLGAVAGGAK